VLLQAQQDQATELVIGVTPAGGDTPIRYKVEDIWYDMSGFPARIRPDVITDLARLAKLPAKQFPSQGDVDVIIGSVHLRWTVTITGADEECILVRARD
jgi:hypothetical protein